MYPRLRGRICQRVADVDSLMPELAPVSLGAWFAAILLVEGVETARALSRILARPVVILCVAFFLASRNEVRVGIRV